jgi:hypothetical protein
MPTAPINSRKTTINHHHPHQPLTSLGGVYNKDLNQHIHASSGQLGTQRLHQQQQLGTSHLFDSQAQQQQGTPHASFIFLPVLNPSGGQEGYLAIKVASHVSGYRKREEVVIRDESDGSSTGGNGLMKKASSHLHHGERLPNFSWPSYHYTTYPGRELTSSAAGQQHLASRRQARNDDLVPVVFVH